MGDTGRGFHLAQIKRGVIGFCVLSILSHGRTYGFDVVRTLGAPGGISVSEGAIYPLLSRLRRSGFVDSSWRTSSQGPPRRYYEITEKGARALSSFKQDWEKFRSSVDRLLAVAEEAGS